MDYQEYLKSKGFIIDIIRIVDSPRKVYEVRLFKSGKSVSYKVTLDGVKNNLDGILKHIYDEYIQMLKLSKKRTQPCYHCLATDYVKKYGDKWICEKCAIFVDVSKEIH
jgi:hypothetical protein